MPFEMGAIPGVSGPVVSEFSFWSGLSFVVEGHRIKPRGLRRRVALPGPSGPVDARLRGGLPGAQVLIVAGQQYATGRTVPKTLQIVGLMPLLALLLVKPWWCFPAVIVALTTNIAILRSNRSDRAKLALLTACTVAACGFNLALAATFPAIALDL